MDAAKLTAAMALAVAGSILTASAARAAGSMVSPGEQRRWALDFRVQLEQPRNKTPVRIRLTGDWISTINSVRARDYDAVLQLANVHVSGDGVPSAAAGAIEEFERHLERPFWGTYRDDGTLVAVHFFRDVDPGDQNLLQMIATEGQLVSAGSAHPVWTALERDGAGSYLATYSREEPNVLTKRKLKYIDTGGGSGAPARALRVTVEQSEFRFSLDPDGGIAGLDGTDRVRIGFADPQKAAGAEGGQLTATTEIHLAKFRRSQAAELIGSLERAGQNVVSSPIVTHNPDPAQGRAQSDEHLLEGHTTESLLVAATVKSGDHTLPGRLAALFRERPKAAVDAVALLRKSGPHKAITDGLGAAGSPAALAALGNLTRDRALPTAVRVDALTALVLVQHPTPEGMRIPVALVEDGDSEIRSVARLISGAVARTGRTQNQAEAEAIDKVLIERYRKAREVAELSDLVAALGNSGGPEVLPVIEEALGDARPALRAAAVRALRLAPGAEIDRLLSAAITSDPEPSVRSDAIFAAGFRRPLGSQLGEALVRAAKSDPADYVRSSAITLLRRNPDASTRIGETLAWVAENDAQAGNRRLAREALASLSGSGMR